MSALDDVLSRVEGVRREGQGYKALCPAHDDRDPSLSVTEMPDGGVRLKCFAGCSTERVVEALGLSKAELSPKRNGHRKPVATYDYTDETGNLLFQVVRYEPKGFSQRRPDGGGGWVTRGVFEGIEPVLYRLPDVIDAIREGRIVAVVEGEEDVHTLERHGLAATTNPMGAGKWRARYSRWLHGADVWILGDNDPPGRRHREQVAEALIGKAASVRVVELPGLPEGGDVTDWFRNGGTAEELAKIAERTSVPATSGEVRKYEDAHGPRVTRFCDMGEPKKREWLVRGLVPKGFPSTVFGDGGTAKSMLAASLGINVAGGSSRWLGYEIDNGPVLYVDFELDADEQRRRVYRLARGEGWSSPPEDLFYLCGLAHSTDEVLGEAVEGCREHGVVMAIVDSMGLALRGDAESASDVIDFHRDGLGPFRAVGTTPLVIDHQSKTRPGEPYRGKTAFGSVYKGNLARSTIQIEPARRGTGVLIVRLRQQKTNFGEQVPPFAARLGFTEEMITVERVGLAEEDLAQKRTHTAREKVLLALESGPRFPRDIEDAANGVARSTLANKLSELGKEGLVEPTGPKEGHARQYRITAEGLSHLRAFVYRSDVCEEDSWCYDGCSRTRGVEGGGGERR